MSQRQVRVALMTGSAQAYGDHADWDCGTSIMLTFWKNELSYTDHGRGGLLANTDDKSEATLKRKGKAPVKIKWFYSGVVTANGKVCHEMSDIDWYREWCRKEKDVDKCDGNVKSERELYEMHRVRCKDYPTSESCEDVKFHTRWLRDRKMECREISTLLICKAIQ